ncbi:MAG TPA: sugar ABC transporter permease [Microlunatus sp.]|nr:sugar ABC transporter permease [Microlunatus sp.]
MSNVTDPVRGPGAAPPRPAPASAVTNTGPWMNDKRFAVLLMVPAGVFLLGFVAWPLIRLVINSFLHLPAIAGGTTTFVGLDNYTKVFTDPVFWATAARTAVYTVIVVTLEFVIGLGTALLFNALGSRSKVFRTIFLYPLMIAPVVAGLLWRFLMIDNFGIINELLFRVGIIATPGDIGWLSNPNLALLAVAIPDIWLTTSFMTLVLFAGLQTLPDDVMEAARLDGAKAWQMLWRVIIPLLRPVIAVALIIRGVDAMRAFDHIVIMTNGGPENGSTVMSLLIYRTMVRFGDPGLASAMATLYLLAMLAVAAFAVATIWKPGGDDK